jgi:hypothetical protein
METGNVWFNTKQDRNNTMTEEEESENQMAEIKNSLPPEVYETFSKCWNDFIDGCSQNVPEGTYADDDGGDEKLWEHLDLFFADTSGEDTENPIEPEIFDVCSKCWGDFIDGTSKNIDDDNDYEKYLDVFMEYPH